MTGSNFVLVIILIALFFHAGRLVYVKRAQRRLAFLNVFVHLLFISLCSAVLLLLLTLLLFALLIAIEFIFESTLYGNSVALLFDDGLKFRGGNMLLLLACNIMAASLLNVHFRNVFRKRFSFFHMEEDDFDIIEYFIQWTTIFLAVYQFIFSGLQSVVSLIDTASSVKTFFNIVLTPDNINLVLQPILISSWITIGIEKLRQRQQASK